MKHVIRVTAKNIRDGKPGSPCFCPVALAMKRAFSTTAVAVAAYNAKVAGRLYDLPLTATYWIRVFDLTGEGKPFSFTVRG